MSLGSACQPFGTRYPRGMNNKLDLFSPSTNYFYFSKTQNMPLTVQPANVNVQFGLFHEHEPGTFPTLSIFSSFSPPTVTSASSQNPVAGFGLVPACSPGIMELLVSLSSPAFLGLPQVTSWCCSDANESKRLEVLHVLMVKLNPS